MGPREEVTAMKSQISGTISGRRNKIEGAGFCVVLLAILICGEENDGCQSGGGGGYKR